MFIKIYILKNPIDLLIGFSAIQIFIFYVKNVYKIFTNVYICLMVFLLK